MLLLNRHQGFLIYLQAAEICREKKIPNNFTDGVPGKAWYYSFLKRHPTITARESMSLSFQRANVTTADLAKWFGDLKDYLIEQDCLDILDDPSRIYNADESGFPFCPKTGKVLAPKGLKHVYKLTNSDKTQITVLPCVSASAHYIPPMLVYPGIRFSYDPLEKFPEGILGRSPNGWMTGDLFAFWLEKVFYEHINRRHVKLPVLLLIDGCKSHIILEAGEFCQQKRIILYCLPPNSTHLTQPLDLVFMNVIKHNWKKEVRKFSVSVKGCRVKRV